METIGTSLVTLAVGGVLGGVIKSLLAYRSQVFSDLWDKRFNSYKELWAILGQIPRWPRAEDVSYLRLLSMSEKMKNWYFDNGGILMSEKTGKKYGNVQEEINGKLCTKREDKNAIIRDEEYDNVQKLCSA